MCCTCQSLPELGTLHEKGRIELNNAEGMYSQFVFSEHENNQFQNTLIIQNTEKIDPSPNYRASYGPADYQKLLLALVLHLSKIFLYG